MEHSSKPPEEQTAQLFLQPAASQTHLQLLNHKVPYSDKPINCIEKELEK